MTERTFYEPRKLSPTGLAVVIAMHAAALGALALVKGPEFIRDATRTIVYNVTPDPVPEPDPPPQPEVQPRQPQPRSVIDQVPPVIERPFTGPVVDRGPTVLLPPIREIGPDPVPEPRVEPTPPPVRVEAEFDPRYAGDMQPPYPPSEERAGREGSVRLRLTIGADGRVKGVQRLSATSDAFWSATQRHAVARWRFRPATLDGRAIESSKTMTVFFRIPD